MLVAFLSGLAAGSVHVVTGPDHLAAVAPLAVRDRRAAVRTGAAWGLGHGTGVVALGGLGMLAREAVDIRALSGWSEFSVGFMLVALGLWSLRTGLKLEIHSHDHAHDAPVAGAAGHLHHHLHVGQAAVDGTSHDTAAHANHTHAAFGVGVFHGAAGMGHLLGVVPALALPPAQAVVYLAAYLVSAVLSMALFGLALGEITRRMGRGVVRGMVLTASVFTIAVGLFWLATTYPGVG